MSKWERGSRKTAALLAAWAITAGNSALTAAATASKRLELLVEEARVGFVGGREVGPDAGQLEVRVVGAGAGQRQHLRRVAVAEPAHAAVVLDVDPGRAALGPGAIGDQAAEALAPDRHLRAGGEDDVDLLGGQRAHRQQRHVLEAAADLLRPRPRSPPPAGSRRPASAASAQPSAPWP